MQKRITDIMEKWFVTEPAMFQVLCLHNLIPNTQMTCPLRSGRKTIEYNPDILVEMSDNGLEEALRAEAVRLLLKHPYERRPHGCSQRAMGLGSNLVIGDNYSHPRFRIEVPTDFGLKTGMSYEWYAEMLEQNGEGGSGDLAELWDEDELTAQLINEVINSTKSWGSLSGNFAEKIKASVRAKINWRNVFAGFRASIISSKRKLTRMKPNRRTGFDNMGSVRQFDTKLLVAVDVSGSISTKSLEHFYGVINSAFRYGFTTIDVIQFDYGVRTVQNLKKVVRDIGIIGRGGTSFQEPVDYAHEHKYDGLLILTDGYAPSPKIPEGFKTRILWVCESEDCLKQHKHWMEESGRTCVMEII